jgi:plastocyanin
MAYNGLENPGDTYTLRFTTPGTYEFICLAHVDRGMRGTVTVLP